MASEEAESLQNIRLCTGPKPTQTVQEIQMEQLWSERSERAAALTCTSPEWGDQQHNSRDTKGKGHRDEYCQHGLCGFELSNMNQEQKDV